jgi:SAM-dependent methyltransferase
MTQSTLIGLNRFHTAAPHYLQGRPAYAPLLIRHVALLCGLEPSHRVLDLGCGPGPLAIAFAPYAGEVVAIDPEPEMLRLAAEEAARAGAAIRVIAGSSADLGPHLGRFRLVVMGRSFHWMDRADTLARLDAMIDREGAVVLFGDRHPELPENGWALAYREVIRRYSADDEIWSRRRLPDWLRNEPFLLASAFGALERVSVTERRETPLDGFVARAFSMSSTSPGRLGDAKAAALAAEIRALMAGHATAGRVAEIVESTALIARRAAPAS